MANMLASGLWRFSVVLRECGQALERVGCNLQGIYSYQEQLSRHTPLRSLMYNQPLLAPDVFVAPSSTLTGSVAVGAGSSVWYNAIIRGDYQPVTIGHSTNIQDGAYISGSSQFSPSVVIGNCVSIGHGAVIKGSTIGDYALVGINAVVSEGAKVGELSIVAAGSYVEENVVIPPGEVWAGSPAKKLRDLKPEEQDHLRSLPTRYKDLASRHEAVMQLLRLKQDEYSAGA